MADSDKIPQIDPTEIEILIEKYEQNKLEERERRLIVALLRTFLYIVAQLHEKKITLLKIKDMIFGRKSEKNKKEKEKAGKGGDQKSDETADATIAIIKSGLATPSNRSAALQRDCGMPLSEFVMSERCEAVAEALLPMYMETIDETALRNQAPLPNHSDFGGRLEARPISQPRCQRTIAEGILKIETRKRQCAASEFSSRVLVRFKQAAGTLQWLYQERLPQSVNAENYDDLRNFDFPQFGG